MTKTQEQLFLEVKERLDYYRLPTIFPIEATNLLLKILTLLDQNVSTNKENNFFPQSVEKGLDSALRHQIGKVLKENNQLHMELMTAKQQIQTLNFRLSKYTVERSDGQSEITQTIWLKDQREKELFQELQEVKFKYNELMDLIHEDSKIQKKYLKRLLKHKKMEIKPEFQPNSRLPGKNKSNDELISQLEIQNRLLLNKVGNREDEIIRLQKKIQYDGINMNKVLKNFQCDKISQKISALNQQINYLEEQNKKLKKQVDYCRKTGGNVEAVRQQMRKNHETIKKISNQNKQLKRKMKELQFDTKAHSKEDKRKNDKILKEVQNQKEETELVQIQNADLQKKVEFYAKELNHLKKELEQEKQKGMKKEITIEQMKNAQEGGKILNQYEIETLKQKLDESNQIIIGLQNQIKKLLNETHYFKEEGILKSQAIDNLEKIVDQLMKKNNFHREMRISEEEAGIDLESNITLRKSLAQLKQLLAVAQNDRMKLQKELNNLTIHYDNALKDKKICDQELSKIKMKICDMRNFQNQLISLQADREKLRTDLQKQEGLRFRVDSLFKQAEKEKELLRQELQEMRLQYNSYEKKMKNHTYELRMSLTALEETNTILQMRLKEKEKRIQFYEKKVDEQQGKLKSITDEILVIEEEKHNLAREKYRLQKRYEELEKSAEDARHKELQVVSLSENEKATEIIWLKKQLHKYEERFKLQDERMLEMQRMCEILKNEKENLFSDKLQFLRENDHLRLRINELEGIVSDRR